MRTAPIQLVAKRSPPSGEPTRSSRLIRAGKYARALATRPGSAPLLHRQNGHQKLDAGDSSGAPIGLGAATAELAHRPIQLDLRKIQSYGEGLFSDVKDPVDALIDTTMQQPAI